MNQSVYQKFHNRNAPYWAAAMILFGIAGLVPNWFDTGNFWEGYGLDICGPAWNYILFRRLGTVYRDNRWVRFFKPWRTLAIFIMVAYAIEGMQFLEWYESTYDPWDLVAYISLLIPLFLLDLLIINRSVKAK